MTFGAIHIWRPWKVFNFQDPPALVQLRRNFFHHMALDVQLQTNSLSSPPLQMITNQLKGNIILGWLLYVIRFFLQVDLTSFHLIEANLVPRAIFRNFKPLFCFSLIAKICAGSKLSWSLTISFFVALHSCVWSCPKILRNVLLKNVF